MFLKKSKKKLVFLKKKILEKCFNVFFEKIFEKLWKKCFFQNIFFTSGT